MKDKLSTWPSSCERGKDTLCTTTIVACHVWYKRCAFLNQRMAQRWRGYILLCTALYYVITHIYTHRFMEIISLVLGFVEVHKKYERYQSTKHPITKADMIPCCWTMLVVKLHARIWLCNKHRKQPTDWVPIVMIVPPRWALIVLIVPPWTSPIDLLLHFCRTKIMVMFAEISNDIAAARYRLCTTVNWGPDKISNERSSDQRLKEKVGLADF